MKPSPFMRYLRTPPSSFNVIPQAKPCWPPIDKTILRFYKKIKIQDGPLNTPCHVWQGSTSGKGRGGNYSRFSVDGKTVAGHIYIFERHSGYRIKGFQIDHLCNNRLCVNLDHLQQVSPETNQQRKYQRLQIAKMVITGARL